MNKLIRGLVTGAAVVAVGVTGFSATAGAAANADRPGGPSAGELPADVLAAMKRDLGLSEAEAEQLTAKQGKSLQADKALRAKLGAAYAGSWLDDGELSVAVTDAAKRSVVRAAGAEAKLVEHGKAKLDGIVAELDKLSGKNGTAADRKAPGKRSAAVSGLSAWHVDPMTNDVVVTVQQGKQHSAAVDRLAKYGDAVRVEVVDASATTTADYLDGGDGYNGNNCSVGFNLRNPSTGQGYLLTAGHCVSAGSHLYGQGWNWFGPVLESWFPTQDDAIARRDGSYFIQGPWVDTNPSNGGFIGVSGYTDAPVGTTVCKSGVTTKWTCGSIGAKNETVTMDGTNTVYGLTRHNACVEPGDSGGANVSYIGGTFRAEGVSSGAWLYNTDKRCGAAVGRETRSWYFPIADSMAYYGPKYGVQVW